jgi:tetratricopeptide (TPR) repeat protein
VLYGLAKGRRSGVLEIESEGEWRRLKLLAGRPVAFESSVSAESFQSVVDASGAVPTRQLKWIVSKLEPGETLEDALLNSGALDEEQIAAFRSTLLERGVGAALQWSSGDWAFTPADHIDPERVDPQLLPRFTLPAGLWRGVAEHVEVASIVDDVTAAGAGDVGIRPPLFDGLEGFEVGSPLDEILGAIGTGASVEVLMRAIQDPAGNLVKLVWLLEIVGLLSRKGRSRQADADLVRSLSTRAKPPVEKSPEPTAAPAPDLHPEDVSDQYPVESFAKPEALMDNTSARMRAAALRAAVRDPEKLAAAVKTDHRRRMGKNYYEFLDIPPDATVAAVQATCARLMRRWQSAARMRELPADTRALADELSKGCALVARTLTDKSRRVEYDRRAARGQAPILRGIQAADASALRSPTNPRLKKATDPRARPSTNPRSRVPKPPGNSLHERAREMLAKGDFDAAVPLLQRARRKEPSNADILAALGWAVHRARGKAHDDGEADEFLRLAVTFAPNHEEALEYLARIAVEGKDRDLAARRLRKLLAVKPNHRWARRTAADLAESRGDDKSGVRRFGFWKRE